MSRIFVTGDTHQSCDIHKLSSSAFKVSKDLTKEDILIITGDAGFVWSYGREPKGEEKFWRDWISEKPWTTFCTMGNHEAYSFIKDFPIVEFYGAPAVKITDSLFYEVRGEIYTFDNKTFLSLGGADSTDIGWRRKGISWWEEEAIIQKQVDKALERLKQYDNKVDYFLTHAGGSEVYRILGFEPRQSDLMLDKVLEKIECKKHYCGHYHVDKVINDRTRILYNDIIEII